MLVLAAIAACVGVHGQTDGNTRQILDRLDRLEKENAALMEEVKELRAQVGALRGGPQAPPAAAASSQSAPAAPGIEDRLAVQQARIEEQAQSKVEAAHKLPIRITGTILFSAFYNTRSDPGVYAGTVLSSTPKAAAGGSLSQSTIGLEFQSPDTVLGARVYGDIMADFFGNVPQAANSSGYGQWPAPRLRTGKLVAKWATRSLTFAVDKPLIAPYNPDSLAQVGVPALSGAGNLWYWDPQARFEQRIRVSDSTTLRLQAALYSTHESSSYVQSEYAQSLESRRPGWEGRAEISRRTGDATAYAIGTGFHFSDTHIAGQTVRSGVFAFDGKMQPTRWLGLTGTFFTGQDLAGLGGAGEGFTVWEDQSARAVHSSGGWLQLTLAPTERLSFHIFGGAQNNRRSDLWGDTIESNVSYAGNVYYQIAPNVFAAFEAGRTRTDWTRSGPRARNLYDLGLAYMF